MTQARIRQAWAIARVELRRAFFSRRGLWVYLLALLPCVMFLGHGIEIRIREKHWMQNGLTPAQVVDSMAQGETVDAVLRRAPNPVNDRNWQERREDPDDRQDKDRDKDKGKDKTPAPKPDEMRALTYFDGHRIAYLHFTNGVLDRKHVNLSRNLEDDRRAFAGIFQVFYLRLAIFFGCLGIFMNLFRGEMLDKTLHFWFLAPVRREVLLAGKYLAGIVAAAVIFGGGALLAYGAMLWPHSGVDAQMFLQTAGWSHAFWYTAAAVLGCLGYGSVFLAAGLLLRNPIIPAAVILVWESINGFLPAVLQQMSVLYYLQSLCPETAPIDENSALARLLFAPAASASKGLAILGLLAVTALVLWAASRAVRRIEINYGAE